MGFQLGEPDSRRSGRECESRDLVGVAVEAAAAWACCGALGIGLKPRRSPESGCLVVLVCTLLGCISSRLGLTGVVCDGGVLGSVSGTEGICGKLGERMGVSPGVVRRRAERRTGVAIMAVAIDARRQGL